MIEIDLAAITEFFNQFETMSAIEIVWVLMFKYWGWLIFIFMFLRFFAYPEYMLYINGRWYAKTTYVLLAIDVPKRYLPS